MQSRNATFAIIFSVAGYSIALGATYAGLALDLQIRGYSPQDIAINAAMTPLGLLVSALVLPKVIRGPVSVWLIGGVIASAVLLGSIAMYRDFYTWLLLRFLLGCATNILFVVGESALMLAISESKSGKFLGIYNGIVTFGYALGPSLMALTDVSASKALIICSTTISLTVIPLMLAKHDLRFGLPKMQTGQGLWIFVISAPALVSAAAATAIFDNAALSLFPVFSMESGYSKQAALTFLSVALVGATVLQWPIGSCADRYNRLCVLRLCALTALVACTAIPFVGRQPVALGVVVFIAGGAAFGTYTAVLALIEERFKGTLLVAANATLGLMWGLGSTVGVPGIGTAMEYGGVNVFGPAVALPFVLVLLLSAIPIIDRSKNHAHSTIPEGSK